MSIGCLRLWTAATSGLIIHPQGDIYEYGKPRRNYIDREKLLILPPELFSNPTSSYTAVSRGDGRRKSRIWPCEVFLFILSKWYFIFLELLRPLASSFTYPPKEGVLLSFVALKNQSPCPGLNVRTLNQMPSTLTITPQRRHRHHHHHHRRQQQQQQQR
jgi:hypothetical protein